MKFARVLVLLATLALAGCASDGSSGAKSSYSEAPAGSSLAKVQVGMDDVEVRKILGDPDNSNAYMTAKMWIPFYFGPDTHRSDWMYQGQGRVVFSRNRYNGELKVIKVLYNADELK
jgi:hypothetical protein